MSQIPTHSASIGVVDSQSTGGGLSMGCAVDKQRTIVARHVDFESQALGN